MTGRTHDLAALTMLGVVVTIHPPSSLTLGTIVSALIANQIGGIFPDIDQPTAPLWRNLPVGSFFGKIFGKATGGHRFLTHSLVGVVGSGIVASLFLQFIHPLIPRINIGFVWWAFMIGVVSHLLMDSLTEEGVPWLLPIPFKFGFPPIKRWRIKTGHWFERIIVMPILVICNIMLIERNYEAITGFLQARIH